MTGLSALENPWIPIVSQDTNTFVYAEGGATAHLDRLIEHNGANVFVSELDLLFPPEVGYGWFLMRRVPPGKGWHPSNDHLAGTSSYGTPTVDHTADVTFSLPWNECKSGELLITYGDFSIWAIIAMEKLHEIQFSRTYHHVGKYYGKSNENEFTLNIDNIVIYAESPSEHYNELLIQRAGSNVFVRKCERVYKCNISYFE